MNDKEIRDEFEKLLAQAKESFNKKYWDESQGPKASSHSKQETLDLLRKAEPLIQKQYMYLKKFEMVQAIIGDYSSYARKVYAYSEKEPFIEDAARLLNKYGQQVRSAKIGYVGNRTQGQARHDAYLNINWSWRALSTAALSQSKTYTPAYCNQQAKKYFEMAKAEMAKPNYLPK